VGLDCIRAVPTGDRNFHYPRLNFGIMSQTSPAAQRRLLIADLAPSGLAWDVATAALGALLVGALAQVSYYLPGMPVPFTGQTLGVLLVAAAVGARRGAAAMALYAGAGIAGVPWFAGGAAGFPKFTFGYLIGFAVAAALVGTLARRGWIRTPWATFAAMLLGTIVIYACGVPWLAMALGGNWATAIASGLTPFLASDALKAALAALMLPAATALLRRR